MRGFISRACHDVGTTIWLRLLTPRHLNRWLTTLSLAISGGFLVLGAGVLMDLRADTWKQAVLASDNLANALAANISRNFALYDAALQGTVRALSLPELAASPPGVRHRILFGDAMTAEYLAAMLIVDPRGDVVEESDRLSPVRLSLAEREHFRVHRDNPDAGLFISRVYWDRIIHEPTIALTRRLNDIGGRFDGIVLAAVRLEYFKHLFESLDVGRQGSVTLFTADGHILMRRPYRPSDIDADISGSGAFEATSRAESGHFVTISKLNGIERLYTFRHIPGTGLVLDVAMGTTEIYQPWWHKAELIGAILLLLCSASVVLSLQFRRELARRQSAEESLVAAAKRLTQAAMTDTLTGLPNRRGLDMMLEREWRRAVRLRTAIAVLMIDLDFFKGYNDRYGHPKGDATLATVGLCLAGHLRRSADLAARYGGEEFIVVLPETDLAGALRMAETIRAAVASEEIEHMANPAGRVTVSCGVAVTLPSHEETPAMLIKQADDALYQAKRAGRNRVVASAAALAEAPWMDTRLDGPVAG